MIRAVDWSTKKADEREKQGRNRSDPYIVAWGQGLNGYEYTREENLDLDNNKSPCIFRGLGKSPLIHKCVEKKIDYYYIDTGYFGNVNTKKWHRVAKNNLQTLNHYSKETVIKKLEKTFHHKVVDQLIDRFNKLHPRCEAQRHDRVDRQSKILLVPPSQKVFNHFGGDAKKWTDNFLKEAKKYTDREIVLRPKVSRSDRLKFTVQDQLRKEGFDSLITFNSIASLEAILVGRPATVLGPNAGSFLSNTDITKIDNPPFPTKQDILDHLFYLSLCQFTVEEMANGRAYELIELLQGDQKPHTFNFKETF